MKWLFKKTNQVLNCFLTNILSTEQPLTNEIRYIEKMSEQNTQRTENIDETEDEENPECFDLSYSEIMKSYNIQRRISHGVSAVVYSLMCLSSRKSFAVKIQYVRKCDREGVLRELNALKRGENHPYIIQFKEFEYVAKFKTLLFIMECATCDLHTYIRKSSPFSLSCVYRFSQHLLDGVAFLHEQLKIMHCDLKPANLLICGDSLKIGDFGLCRPISDTMESYLVTRWYRCPELLTSKSTFDERIDIWSIGCIVWEMMFTKPLFKGRTEEEVLTNISIFFEKTNTFENCTCDKLRRLLSNSVVYDYTERWSASSLLSIFEMHPTLMINGVITATANAIDFSYT